MKHRFRPAAGTLLLLALSAALVAQSPLQYPTTKKVDHVDTYHGTKVPDPYRWLEDDMSNETGAWVEAQNKITFPYLEAIPYRQQLHARVKQLNDYPEVLVAVAEGPVLLLQQERRPAEPERPLHPERARGHARGPARPEQV